MSIKQEMAGTFTSYQQQLKALIKARKQIVEKMSQLSKKRFFLQAQPKTKQNQQQNTQNLGQPRKITKLDSCASLSGVSDQQTPKKQQRIRSISNLGKQQQKSQTIKKLNQQMAQRNRRMFQGLNLHLDKAKNKLQQQKPKRQQRNEVLQNIQKKQKQKSQQLLKQQLEKIKVQFTQQEKMKNENSKQILRIQNLILKNSYSQYADVLKTFTFTRAEPSISWRPNKEVQVAKKLLGQRQQEIQLKNKKIIQSIQKYESKFDYSLYLLENEHQFYRNLLKNYYRDVSSLLKTQNEPSIYWRPAKQIDRSKIKMSDNKKVEEIIQKNKTQCQAYYNQKIAFLKQRRQKGHCDEHDGQSHSLSPHHKQEQD